MTNIGEHRSDASCPKCGNALQKVNDTISCSSCNYPNQTNQQGVKIKNNTKGDTPAIRVRQGVKIITKRGN